MTAGRIMLGGAAALLAVLIAAMFMTSAPPPPPPTGTAEAVGEAPASEQAVAPSESVEPAEETRDAARMSPRIDVARVERDGEAVFAGVATPGAMVDLRIDGVTVASAQAGDDGGFVAFGRLDDAASVQRLEVIDSGDAIAPASGSTLFVALPDEDAPANARPIVAKAEATGVTVLQPRTLDADETLALDAVSYTPAGAFDFSGRGPRGVIIRVFADATMLAETKVSDQGRWTTRADAELAPGAYTLRVEALDGTGRKVDAIVSPFVREAALGRKLGPSEIVIQPGDTLWGVAATLLGAGSRYTVIYAANSSAIDDPDVIFPGQVFTVPLIDQIGD